MIKLENTKVVGWEAAIRGMRNPLNSWDKSDTFFIGKNPHCDTRIDDCSDCAYSETCNASGTEIVLGDNDLELMKKLSKAGTDHRKFMRMIIVYVDITAPMYFWKQLDQYKVGTVRLSTNTMHTIIAKEFDYDDFSHEHFDDISMDECFDYYEMKDCDSYTVFNITISALNFYRKKYLETKDKKYWWQIIQLLPSSYNQKSTLMLNYAVLANIYHSRKNHKLAEWHELCKWIENLPYSEIITGEDK
jgi:hypothetical protein